MGCADPPSKGVGAPHQCPLNVCKLTSIYADNCVCKLNIDDVITFEGTSRLTKRCWRVKAPAATVVATAEQPRTVQTSC